MSTRAASSLRDAVVQHLRPYASRIELFGSAARGDAGPDSDVDILVVLRPEDERPRLGLRWFELEAELADTLGRPVEIVTERALSPHVRPFIEPDRRVIYEDE